MCEKSLCPPNCEKNGSVCLETGGKYFCSCPRGFVYKYNSGCIPTDQHSKGKDSNNLRDKMSNNHRGKNSNNGTRRTAVGVGVGVSLFIIAIGVVAIAVILLWKRNKNQPSETTKTDLASAPEGVFSYKKHEDEPTVDNHQVPEEGASDAEAGIV